jgi:hypothetical protein
VENQEKTVIKPDDGKIKKAAAEEQERQRKLGHGQDGHYVILEMDQSSGAQTLISAPNLSIPIKNADGTQALDPESGEPLYQWQALVFAHPQQAEEWVKERGESGFSYLILSAVGALQGQHTEKELIDLAAADAESMQEAVRVDQERRKA